MQMLTNYGWVRIWKKRTFVFKNIYIFKQKVSSCCNLARQDGQIKEDEDSGIYSMHEIEKIFAQGFQWKIETETRWGGVKSKDIPQQAEVTLGVPGRLRPWIFSTFGTTRMVVRQPNVPTAFTPKEIPGTHFHKLSRPQGTWFCRKEPRKKSQVKPLGIDPGTVRLVAQRCGEG
jgi:hypothetical protein